MPLPPGLSINPNTGLISGTPTFGGHYIVVVRADNTRGASVERYEMDITDPQMPVITTTTLPQAEIGYPYEYQMHADGATPIIWASGSLLPPGLLMSASGEISGSPLQVGAYSFKIIASNEYGSDVKVLSLIVGEVLRPVITTESLPDGEIISTGSLYRYQLEANGARPITWTLVDGALPVGMSLLSNGRLEGRVLEPGEFSFQVKAANAHGSDVKRFSLTIIGGESPVIITTSLPSGTIINEAPFLPYSFGLEATGKRPMRWFIDSQTPLPIGMTIDPDTGELKGRLLEPGTFSFDVWVVNAVSSDIQRLSVTVRGSEAPRFVHSGETLPTAHVGEEYSYLVEISGKRPIETNVISEILSRGLPPGLSITAGLIHGTPTAGATGTYMFRLAVTSARGFEESSYYNIPME